MKKRYLLILLVLLMSLWSCNAENSNTTVVNDINDQQGNTAEEKVVLTDEHEAYGFIQGDEATTILAADDDYTIKLSTFDYASKYRSDRPLDAAERKTVIEQYVLDWRPSQKTIMDEAMAEILPRIEAMGIDMPKIQFILTTRDDEGGAAYTRENAIILKPFNIQAGDSLNRLITHEMFHVYSRAHKELREAMYGVIHYEKCEELVIPPELAELTIANPDAPNNNYYINGTYEGETLSFIPLIYSSQAYDIDKGGSFFTHLQDNMLAVEIVDGVAEPIYRDSQPLVVTKDKITDYFDKIGENTQYTYHPEETMADNFVALIFEDDVPSPWVVDGLKAIVAK